MRTRLNNCSNIETIVKPCPRLRQIFLIAILAIHFNPLRLQAILDYSD